MLPACELAGTYRIARFCMFRGAQFRPSVLSLEIIFEVSRLMHVAEYYDKGKFGKLRFRFNGMTFLCNIKLLFVTDIKRTRSHLTKGTIEKETWINSASYIQRCMIVGTNKQMTQMVGGWNKLSKRRYFEIVSQLERCLIIWKRHPNPHVLWAKDFSTDISEKMKLKNQWTFAK